MLGYLIMAALTVVPFWMFLPRFNLPSWFAIFSLTPFTVIPLLWIMAYRDQIKIPGIDK
ncbi:NADH dehydrogenase [Pseudaestuariivita atlantica]|uniref:NADH dehydrogenase n=2 Tax=Pseudaestuariivita atlantica TaxID=1317121 RepID=A0A0L1JM96_9RHOB|nr:NADH dehydrogenase [Pseudaestuariivita atlantica]